MSNRTAKSKRFQRALEDAKEALESIGVPFHLHAGTALGAQREHDFIAHDGDLDLAVFYADVNKDQQVKAIEDAMYHAGFDVVNRLGQLDRGKEIQFEHAKTGVPLDIFWVYNDKYRGKDYNILGSYFGDCDNYKYKMCVWAYRPYNTKRIKLHGKYYNTIPTQTLVDMYGADWKTPKKFGYDEGIREGGYKGFIPDFFEPKTVDTRIAYCFLLYDTVKHRKIWETYFNEDRYQDKSYSIYAHLKEVTDKTPPWINKNKVPSIKTGWCEANLVWAWIKMLKEALKDPKNKYFCLLSGECIPLFKYWETYNKITASPKSYINVTTDHLSWEIGLYYADQWVILNRDAAKTLIDLKDTIDGKEWIKKLPKAVDDWELCPDEIYPINWFVYNYGVPSSSEFKKNFKIGPSTYTYWPETSNKPHPLKFTRPKMLKMKREICKSGAVFGRKFNNPAAAGLAMGCDQYN